MLKTLFVCLYIVLALWVLKIIVFDSSLIVTNPYNPRLTDIESHFIRGAILDRNGERLAYETSEDANAAERVYPYGASCGQLVGYNNRYKAGLELEANPYLLHAGSLVDSLKYWLMDETVAGCDVWASADAELQQYAYDLFGDRNGVVLMSNASNGEVLVRMSKPSYDPQSVLEQWDELEQDDDGALFNRIDDGLYPPGSTFKMLVSLAWLRSDLYDADLMYTCQGTEHFDDFELPCIHHNVHGTQNINDAFAYSCNTFFASLGTRIGADALAGAMESVGIEDCGIARETELSRLAMDSIGQGDVVLSPAKLHRLTCAVAEDGYVCEDKLLRYATNQENAVVHTYPDTPKQKLLSKNEADYLRDLMRGVCAYGTATNVGDLPYPTYGKTGTAENETGYDHSWFTGYMDVAPGERVAVTVLVEQSGGRLSASYVATLLYLSYLDSYHNAGE